MGEPDAVPLDVLAQTLGVPPERVLSRQVIDPRGGRVIEPWEAAPRGAAAQMAFDRFLDAYVASGGVAVRREAFAAAFRCCRVFKKLVEIDDLLDCLVRSGCDPDDRAHARWYARDTPEVVAAALASW